MWRLSEVSSPTAVLLKYSRLGTFYLAGSFGLLLDFTAYKARLVAVSLENNQGRASKESTLGLFLQCWVCFNSLIIVLDFIYLFIFMCMPAVAACLSVYLCRGQKVLNPLRLDLQL